MAARDYDKFSRTVTLERTPQARTTVKPEQPAAPRRKAPNRHPQVRPHVPRAKTTGRLGSQQVVSYRGRRVTPNEMTKKKVSVTAILLVLLLVGGVVAAMALSAFSTTQTFTIQRLQSEERALYNQVETLNRDLEQLRSAQHVAGSAREAGMLIPSAPGVLEALPEGGVERRREFDPQQTLPLVDVNDAGERVSRPSSDQDATKKVGESLTQLPGGNVLGQPGPRIDNVVPYAPNVPELP